MKELTYRLLTPRGTLNVIAFAEKTERGKDTAEIRNEKRLAEARRKRDEMAAQLRSAGRYRDCRYITPLDRLAIG